MIGIFKYKLVDVKSRLKQLVTIEILVVIVVLLKLQRSHDMYT